MLRSVKITKKTRKFLPKKILTPDTCGLAIALISFLYITLYDTIFWAICPILSETDSSSLMSLIREKVLSERFEIYRGYHFLLSMKCVKYIFYK